MNKWEAKSKQIGCSKGWQTRLFQLVQIHDKPDPARPDSIRPKDADPPRLDPASQRLRRVRHDTVAVGAALVAPDAGAIIRYQPGAQRHEVQCQR